MDANKLIELQECAYNKCQAPEDQLKALYALQVFCNENEIATGVSLMWTADSDGVPFTYDRVQVEIDRLEEELAEQ